MKLKDSRQLEFYENDIHKNGYILKWLYSLFFLRYIQNNLEYLIQNMIYHIDQIFRSMLGLIF